MRDFALSVFATIVDVHPREFGSYGDRRASKFQLFLPASLGGCAVPDPVLLAKPCFLASFAAALANLRGDPTLGPLLRNPLHWHASTSPTLRHIDASFARTVAHLAFAPARPFSPKAPARGVPGGRDVRRTFTYPHGFWDCRPYS